MKQLRSNRLGLLCLSFFLCLGVGISIKGMSGEVKEARASISDDEASGLEVLTATNFDTTAEYVFKSTDGYYWNGASGTSKNKWGGITKTLSDVARVTIDGTYADGFSIKDSSSKYLSATTGNFSWETVTGSDKPATFKMGTDTSTAKNPIVYNEENNGVKVNGRSGIRIYTNLTYNDSTGKSVALYKIPAANPDKHNIAISGDNNVEINKTLQLMATCKDGDTFKWTSSDATKATIDEDTGLVTGVAEGTVTITATCQTDTTATITKEITVWKEPDVVTDKTVAEVATLATKEDKTTLYQVTGYISAWVGTSTNGTQYGNYYLKDLDTTANSSLYVYGSSADTSKLTYDYSTTSYAFTNPRDFLQNDTTKGIDTTLGYVVTIKGYIRKVETSVFALTGVITKLEEPVKFTSLSVEASSTAQTVYNLQDEFNPIGFVVKASDADGSNVRTLTTDNFTWNPTKFTEVVDKVTFTGSGIYEGLSASTDVAVKNIGFDISPSGDDIEVELGDAAITYTISGFKGFVEDELMYEWKSSTDGIIEFSADDEESTAISFKAVGTTTISILVTDLSDNELTKSFKITVSAATTKFELVENNLTDFTGEYIIAYSFGTGKSYACNGVDATSGNYFQIDLNDNIATAKDESKLVTVIFEKSGSGYLIKLNGGTNDGKYFSYSGSDNGFSVGTEGTVNSISVSNSEATISNGSINYQCLNNQANLAFRYYKSAQKLPSLYKKVSKTANAEALTYAKLFNEAIGCNSAGITAPTGWDDVKSAWSDGTISTEAQIILINVDLTTENDEDIKKCIATYEYIVAKYNKVDSTKYNDFMGRNVVTSSSNVINKINTANSSAFIISAIISCLSITSLIGGALLFRKRKEN